MGRKRSKNKRQVRNGLSNHRCSVEKLEDRWMAGSLLLSLPGGGLTGMLLGPTLLGEMASRSILPDSGFETSSLSVSAGTTFADKSPVTRNSSIPLVSRRLELRDSTGASGEEAGSAPTLDRDDFNESFDTERFGRASNRLLKDLADFAPLMSGLFTDDHTLSSVAPGLEGGTLPSMSAFSAASPTASVSGLPDTDGGAGAVEHPAKSPARGAAAPTYQADSMVPPGIVSSELPVSSTIDSAAEPKTPAESSATSPGTSTASTAEPAVAPLRAIPLGFDNGLDGWTVSESGGSEAARGGVTAGSAVLTEGDSFLVTLEQGITLPDSAKLIRFRYSDLSFDTSDPSSINDAFEVALVDGEGGTLVHSFAPGREAFFNATEGESTAVGEGTTVSENGVTTVDLDISTLFAGTEATLVFRLVNNDTDTATTVTILDVSILGDDQPPTVSAALANDTAPTGVPADSPYLSDLLTNDPTIIGTAADDVGVAKLEAIIDGNPPVDITASLVGRQYSYDPASLSPGLHTITIRATDALGQAVDATVDFQLNAPPVADAGENRTIVEGATVDFDASASSDSDGTIYAFQWMFDDGTTVDGPTASRHYPADGSYSTILKITDSAGSVVTDTVLVTVEDLAPTAAFTWTPEPQDEGTIVQFTDQSTSSPDSIVSWNWNFDGLGTSTAQNPNFTFADNGSYTVTLTVTDEDGSTDTISHTVTVTDLAPTAAFTWTPELQDEGMAVQFTDLSMSSPDSIISWNWNFDGLGTSTAQNPTFTFADNGSYTVTLTVTDEDGSTDTASHAVTVSNVAPLVAPAADQTILPGTELSLTVATFEDAGFTSAAAGSEETFTAEIDWGDGVVEAGQVVVTQGSIGVLTTGAVAGMHTYAAEGSYNVTVTVTDDDGDSGSASFAIHVGQQTGSSCIYEVPGSPGDLMAVTFTWTEKDADYQNELGIFQVDDLSGLVGSNLPGDSMYAHTALTSANQQVVFERGETVGEVTQIILPAGTLLTPYLIQNSTTDQFLKTNPDNQESGSPLAFFCFAAANPDGYHHFQRTDLPGGVVQFAAEDLLGGGDEDFNDLVFTISVAPVPEPGPTKFYVVDGKSDAAFRYSADGTAGDDSELDMVNNSPRGVTSNIAGDTYWVIDANKQVFVYNADGSLRGDWKAHGVSRPEGIATDGTDIWIVDAAHDRVVRFENAASRLSGSQDRDSKFSLHWQNKSPTGITTDGNTIWVTDESRNKVYIYGADGHFEGRWRLDPRNGYPTGITLDPTGGTDLWVVDRTDDLVYHYAGAMDWRWEGEPAASTFALAEGNRDAEGIADPPVPQTADSLDDVSGSLVADYGRTSFDQATSLLYTEVSVQNTGQLSIDTPILVGVSNLSDPSVEVLGADGLTEEGIPYFDFTALVPGASLQPAATTAERAIAFFNPQEIQFSYDLVYLGKLSHLADAVTAALANDTAPGGAINDDGITSDPTISGQINNLPAVSSLHAQLDFSAAFPVSFDASGNFLFDPGLARDGSQDGDHLVRLIAEDPDGNSAFFDVSITLDTTAPATPAFDLAAAFDTDPKGDHQTAASYVTLVGNTDPLALVELAGSMQSTTADASGQFQFAGVALQFGENQFTTRSSDVAGNESQFTEMLTRVAPDESILLQESEAFVVETVVPVDLGQSGGSRTLQFEVGANFDRSDTLSLAEDVFLVYLLDSTDPTHTLLDRGTPGTALFSLAGDQTDYPPGLVRFDGTTVQIDLTSLSQQTSGNLLFQLLNVDSDTSSQVVVHSFSNTVDPEGVPSPHFPVQATAATAGSTIDLAALSENGNLHALVSNVHFNSTTGRYTAELRVKNMGAPINRQVAVMFPDLPAGVEVLDPSGTDASGVPYINLRDVIPRGGLGAGATSDAVQIDVNNPGLLRFNLAPRVLSDGPNHAPDFDPVGSLEVMPGGHLEVPLSATDPDGDRVVFSLRSEMMLPNATLRADGTLVLEPNAEHVGSYGFTLVASDGAMETTHSVTLEVVADPLQTTRISGMVLNTNGEPLGGIPVELGSLQTITSADGSFTLELLTNQPREYLDIAVPLGDVYFDPFGTGTQSIHFARSNYDPATGTGTENPRQQVNLVSSFLDGSSIYGSDPERAAALRTFDGTGRLKMSPGDLLPFNSLDYFPDGPLTNINNGQESPTNLFAAGDVRANDNVALASVHTLLIREHNRLADQMRLVNPTLSGDDIYERARRIVVAELQHITYQEFLPVLLGAGAIPAYPGYNPNVDPTVGNFFATVAARFGHSLANPQLLTVDNAGNQAQLLLREITATSGPVVASGIEPILRGLAAQQTQAIDLSVITELRNLLFGPPGSGGLDLVAMNIQRGRDHGLPDYNQARVDYGLAPVTTFADITSDTAVQQALQATYGSVGHIDPFVGGLAENSVPGAMVGELLRAVLAEQYQRLRDGDRFWYENGQLTTEELADIRATKLSDLIRRNTTITDIPDNVFTTGPVPAGPVAGGASSTFPPSEYRSVDGFGNNVDNPVLGSAGQQFLRNTTVAYADGISTPAGSDRPGPRELSNALFDQSSSLPNSVGATDFLTFWGQLVAHDTDFAGEGTPDSLRIHGEQFGGPEAYPFVAEKTQLMLGRPLEPGVNNVIARPIYLPGLDMANAVTVDPTVNTSVTVPVRQDQPPVTIQIAAGTLEDQRGNLFDGQLSITEVPPSLTPAALPSTLLPDLVVTIQPAEMVFTTPAPITFPNTAGWAPGTVMDLWSINPVTGEFEDVGDMLVSSDGSVIETTSGGLRNSSWHFFVPPAEIPIPPIDDPRNQDEKCEECEAKNNLTSEVKLHSGGLVETHGLVEYHSLGVSRGLTLTYNSEWADPRPILHFGFANFRSELMYASLVLRQGTFSYEVPGFTPDTSDLDVYKVPRGAHFWSGFGAIDTVLQIDMRDLPSGQYDYQLDLGTGRIRTRSIVEDDGGSFGGFEHTLTGSSRSTYGQLISVNNVDSPFGAGWSIGGLQTLIENSDGSLLLIDGGGSELLFEVSGAGSYASPTGDFSVMEKLTDGRFRRTLPDQTVFNFDAAGRLETIVDRNGNLSEYRYDAEGRPVAVVDPVGLETTFTYSGDRISAITDPAGRTTVLEHDESGNLVRIIDPDGTFRTFGYDGEHHMTSEVDKGGAREEARYGFHGRVVGGVRKDGSEMFVDPVQTQGLLLPDRTIDPLRPASIYSLGPVISSYADTNGTTTATTLDGAGQLVSATDAIGSLGSVVRNSDNQIVSQTDGRGYTTSYWYDNRGNITRILDSISEQVTGGGGISFSDPITSQVVDSPYASNYWYLEPAVGDLNLDGYLDTVITYGGDYHPPTLVTLISNDDGTVAVHESQAMGDRLQLPGPVLLGDLDGDSDLDSLAVINPYPIGGGYGDSLAKVLVGNNDGTLTEAEMYELARGGDSVRVAQLADIDEDGDLDLVAVVIPYLTGTSKIRVLLGNGDATFAVPIDSFLDDGDNDPFTYVYANGMKVTDIDGDGNIDVILSINDENGVSVLLGDGQGNFGSATLLPIDTRGYGTGNLTVGDVDNDGDEDIVVVRSKIEYWGINQALTVIRNDSTPGNVNLISLSERTDIGVRPEWVSLADIDFDGNLDAVFSNGDGTTVSVLPGLGDGTFGDEIQIPAGASAQSMGVADVDRDSDPDILVVHSGNISVLLNTTEAATGGSTGEGVLLSYDPDFNQLSSITDELGRQTLFELDDRGNVLRSTEVVGDLDAESGETDDIVTGYTYTTYGQIDTVTDPLGRVTDRDYDQYGRLVTVTTAKGTPDEAVTRFEHADLSGNITATIDPEQNRSEFEYDALNRIISITEADPDGPVGPLTSPVSIFDYDNSGNLTTVIDPRGNRTENSYDMLDRLVRTVDAEGQVTAYDYDKAGNLRTVVDPLGHVTKNYYDSRNRLARTVDAEGQATVFYHGRDDNLMALRDPEGNLTRFVYDARDRLIREVDPLGKAIQNTYDAADNLVSVTDRNGRVTQFKYDDLDRLVTETWLNVDQTRANVVQYSYDAVSNLTSVIDDFSALTFTYDSLNRVATVDNTGTPNAPNVLLTYTYDTAGNVLSVSDNIEGADAGLTEYVYDSLDRVFRITQAGTGVAEKRVDFGYNELGQYASISRFSDLAGTQQVVTSTYTYDTLNRLESLVHNNGTTDVAFYNFSYDEASRITSIFDVDGTSTYSYDATNQLVGAEHTDGVRPDESYEYDANGNRVSSHLHGTDYQTGPGNRLLSDGTYNYEYDDEGNLVRRTEIAAGSTREFAWDYRNRLVKVVDKDPGGGETQRVEFTYDALDRRITKSVDTNPQDAVDAVITHFVYDREDVILDFVDSDGISGPVEPVLARRYLHGPTIDQVLAQENADGEVQWHLTDHLGTVRDLVDDTGAVVNHITYDSFGEVIAQTNSAFDTRYGFTGREYDAQISLYYYRMRYYDAVNGAFLAEDSLRFTAKDTNLYRYVGNAPLLFRDPMGQNGIAIKAILAAIDLASDLISRHGPTGSPSLTSDSTSTLNDFDSVISKLLLYRQLIDLEQEGIKKALDSVKGEKLCSEQRKFVNELKKRKIELEIIRRKLLAKLFDLKEVRERTK